MIRLIDLIYLIVGGGSYALTLTLLRGFGFPLRTRTDDGE